MIAPVCCNGDGPGYVAHTGTCDALVDWCAKTLRMRDCGVRGTEARSPSGDRLPRCPIDAWVKGMVDSGIADRHAQVILANLLGTPLEATLPMEVAYCLVERVPRTIRHDLRRGSEGTEIRLQGTEVLVGLVGSRGVGKTLAASYIIAHVGGQLVTAYKFARPGLEIDSLVEQRGALVIDQLGREFSKSEWSIAQLEEVIVERHARNRLTILIGNIDRIQFNAKYESIIEDRFHEDGAFVVCYGDSLRSEP